MQPRKYIQKKRNHTPTKSTHLYFKNPNNNPQNPFIITIQQQRQKAKKYLLLIHSKKTKYPLSIRVFFVSLRRKNLIFKDFLNDKTTEYTQFLRHSPY
jgi:hypothetical protein